MYKIFIQLNSYKIIFKHFKKFSLTSSKRSSFNQARMSIFVDLQRFGSRKKPISMSIHAPLPKDSPKLSGESIVLVKKSLIIMILRGVSFLTLYLAVALDSIPADIVVLPIFLPLQSNFCKREGESETKIDILNYAYMQLY